MVMQPCLGVILFSSVNWLRYAVYVYYFSLEIFESTVFNCNLIMHFKDFSIAIRPIVLTYFLNSYSLRCLANILELQN